MKTLLLLSIYVLVSLSALAQDNVIKKNNWTTWKTDTVITQDGKMNVTKKRNKLSSKNNCLITEEVIFFHDECKNVIRMIKLRSDCNRNIGEGSIVSEKNYRSKCL